MTVADQLSKVVDKTNKPINPFAPFPAPHQWKGKNSHNPPMGVPGLETMLPLLVTAAEEGKLSYGNIMKLCAANPARIFGIPNKGKIQEGFDADLVILDPTAERTVDPDALYTKCGWTPFEGMEVKGKIKKVTLRGKTVFEEGKVFGPFGQIIFP